MSGQEQAPAFSIQRVYLKGMSLEMPNAPAIFLESQQPSVEVAVDVSSLTIVEGIHETAVTVTLTTRVGDKVAFLIETTQAGIFEIRNVPADQMDVRRPAIAVLSRYNGRRCFQRLEDAMVASIVGGTTTPPG